MTAAEIDISEDAAALATYVAERFLSQLATAQSEGRRPHVGLTGGTIANLIYAEVARLGATSSVDWNEVVFWWGDERFVPEASPDRNSGQARRAFLDVLPIPAQHINQMPSTDDADSAEHGAELYGDLLRQRGAGEFEILLLGVGPDGHIASLFPGFPQLERDDTIALGVYGSPKPPPERITLSLPCLNRSREVWFLASGAEKAPAIATALAQSPAQASRGSAEASRSSAEASRGSAEASRSSAEASRGSAQSLLPAARVTGRVMTMWFLDGSAAAGLA